MATEDHSGQHWILSKGGDASGEATAISMLPSATAGGLSPPPPAATSTVKHAPSTTTPPASQISARAALTKGPGCLVVGFIASLVVSWALL